MKVSGLPTTFVLTWLNDKGVITTEGESIQIFNSRVFTAGPALFSPHEEDQLATGMMSVAEDRTSDLFQELKTPFGDNPLLRAHKERYELCCKSLFNRAVLAICQDGFPNLPAQVRPDPQVAWGSISVVANSAPVVSSRKQGQIDSTRNNRAARSSSSSRNQESPLRSSWAGQDPQSAAEGDVQINSSASKASKTITKEPKTKKKSKTPKHQTHTLEEEAKKPPRRDGEGDDDGAGLC